MEFLNNPEVIKKIQGGAGLQQSPANEVPVQPAASAELSPGQPQGSVNSSSTGAVAAPTAPAATGVGGSDIGHLMKFLSGFDPSKVGINADNAKSLGVNLSKFGK